MVLLWDSQSLLSCLGLGVGKGYEHFSLSDECIQKLLPVAYAYFVVVNRKRLMFCTRVKQNKLETYLDYHRAVWPEVESGLRKFGITLLTIHAPKDGGNLLQMYIETEPGVDLADLGPGSAYRSSDRVGAWEALMDSMFEGGCWTLLEPVYTLTPCSSTNTQAPNYCTS